MTSLLTLALDFSRFSDKGNWTIPLLGILLITIGMLLGIRKKRHRSGTNVTARDRVEELRNKQAVRGDLEQLMIEVEQLAKRFGSQLDAKTMQMERLIDEANQKIHELKQLEQARKDAMALQGSSTTPPTPQALFPGHPPESTAQATSPEPDPDPAPATDPDTELKDKVCGLADQGHDPVEIARRLDEHVGKVELILALRKA